MIALTPALQRFDWGSSQGIPDLLGFAPDGGPYAEAWWGAHPSAPSTTDAGALDALIAAEPVATLGEVVAREYGRLPYLLKVLSIARPLSIQVHPVLERARSGFAEEERGGVDMTHPQRTYKDASHKPEMLVALSDMTVLSGFRPEADLMSDLLRMGGADAERLRASLADGGTSAYVTTVLTAEHPDAIARLAAGMAGESASAAVACETLIHYPGDAGALVALAMNAVRLAPGEALFTPSGTVHCYIHGDGVEIMANSDNVVRAGLTHKQVNADLLRELAVLEPAAPVVPHATVGGATTTFTTGADEFQLAVVRSGAVTAGAGPRIVLAIEGCARLSTAADSAVLCQGEAVFVAASEGPVTIDAEGVVVIASMPVLRD